MNLAIFDCCDCRSGKGLTGDDNLDGLGNQFGERPYTICGEGGDSCMFMLA